MRSVLITGAASGIGAAVCDFLLANGYRVYALDVSPTPKKDNLMGFIADIRNESELCQVAEKIKADGVTLEAIINVAGIHAMTSLVEGDFERIKRLMDINLCGTMLVNKVFHPHLDKKGRIIIVTSEVATFAPMPFNGLYTISKNALESYAQALRQELNLIGQKVITIRPGAIETPLCRGSVSDTDTLAKSTVLYKKQAGRFCNIASKFMGTPMKAEKLAKLVYRALTSKHPKLSYKKHRNLGLILLNLLPLRMQCFVIKLLLNA